MKTMRTTKKVVPALVMLIISALLLTTASYAWFATFTSVTATGVKVNASVPTSLLIGGSATTINASTLPLDGTLKTLHSATHDTVVVAVASDLDVADKSALKYVKDENLGLVSEDGYYDPTGTFETVDASGSSQYYKDYVMYVSATDAGHNADELIVNVAIASPASIKDLSKAIAIDFYAKNLTAEATTLTYKGTVWLEDTTGAITLASSVPNINDSTPGYIKVVARVYLDGAKTDSSSAYYVKLANAIQVEDITINFSFTTQTP
ncbi:MAG: hypothetical protein WCR95_06580 [Eubacteriales bacterium]